MTRAGKNKAEEWSEKEFDEELSSKMLWSSSAKMFVFDYEALYELADDPRVPENKAAKLKDLLNDWEKLNERVKDVSPKNKKELLFLTVALFYA